MDRIAHQVASGLALMAALSGSRVGEHLAAMHSQSAGPDRPDAARAAIRAVRTSGIVVSPAGRVEGAAGVAVEGARA